MDAIKTFVVDCVLEAGADLPADHRRRGRGGTADLCVHSPLAATRPLLRCEDPEGAKLEAALRRP